MNIVILQAESIYHRYCGVYHVNFPTEGVGVYQDSVKRLDFPGTQLTSIASDVVNGLTVVYMGSNQGQVDKVGYNIYVEGVSSLIF